MNEAIREWEERQAKQRREEQAQAEVERLQGLIHEARHFVNCNELPPDEYCRQYCGKIAEVLSDDTIGEAFDAVAQQPDLWETAIRASSIELMLEIKSGHIDEAAASLLAFCHEDIELVGEIRRGWEAVWDAVAAAEPFHTPVAVATKSKAE